MRREGCFGYGDLGFKNSRGILIVEAKPTELREDAIPCRKRGATLGLFFWGAGECPLLARRRSSAAQLEEGEFTTALDFDETRQEKNRGPEFSHMYHGGIMKALIPVVRTGGKRPALCPQGWDMCC